MDLSPTSWKSMCMGLRSLQLWSKSPEQSCTMCSTEMLKQTLFFLSRKHGTGPQRGQTLTKGLAGTSPAALHTYWSWILKKVTHQETGRAELLWGEEKLGNEGNLREVLYCLNKTGLAVEMESIESLRQGEKNSQVQDPPREPIWEMRLEMGLWHRSNVHSGQKIKLPYGASLEYTTENQSASQCSRGTAQEHLGDSWVPKAELKWGSWTCKQALWVGYPRWASPEPLRPMRALLRPNRYLECNRSLKLCLSKKCCCWLRM